MKLSETIYYAIMLISAIVLIFACGMWFGSYMVIKNCSDYLYDNDYYAGEQILYDIKTFNLSTGKVQIDNIRVDREFVR